MFLFQLSDEDDLEDTIHLELGQNLFEIHISKVRNCFHIQLFRKHLVKINIYSSIFGPPLNMHANDKVGILDVSLGGCAGSDFVVTFVQLYRIIFLKVEFSSGGLRQLKDEEPNVFCTWEFYEFEIQSTPVRKGQRFEFYVYIYIHIYYILHII